MVGIVTIDPGAAPAARKPLYKVLYFWVLLAIFLGGLLGYLSPELGASLQPLGDAFIKLVRMIIAPVIFLTVANGIAGMESAEKVGRIGGKTIGYFLVFSTLALIVGLFVGNLLQPGAGMNVDLAKLDPKALDKVREYASNHDLTIVGFLMNIIPSTVVDAFAKGDILQVLFFAVLFGFSLSALGPKAKMVNEFLGITADAIFKVVNTIMKAAPIGAFGAMAFTIGKFGIKALINLAFLIGTFYITSFLFVVVVLGVVAYFNGFSILKLLRYISNELALVLGTSSSESALPSLMLKMEKAGCDKSVVGLVVPAGYSFNLDGTNIYMTLAVLFLAQATNTHLSLWDQLIVLAVAMLSSKGAAGITGAGFITLAATLSVVPSVPVAAMAIILGIDRFMSECRALTNFAGNAVACIVIARWEKACDMDRLKAALDGGAD